MSVKVGMAIAMGANRPNIMYLERGGDGGGRGDLAGGYVEQLSRFLCGHTTSTPYTARRIRKSIRHPAGVDEN